MRRFPWLGILDLEAFVSIEPSTVWAELMAPELWGAVVSSVQTQVWQGWGVQFIGQEEGPGAQGLGFWKVLPVLL